MNYRFSLLVCLLIAASLLGMAATSRASETGLIGKRWAGPDFIYDHFTGSAVDKAFGAAAEMNLPLTRALDLNLNYSYSDATGNNYDALEKRLGASAVMHRWTDHGTAYFSATLGHSWRSADILGVGSRNNAGFWGARAGYEVPWGARTAIDAGIGYTDSFERQYTSAQVLSYRVAANHWFSRDLAGVLSVTYRQIKASPDAVTFGGGLRWAF